jgi:hypothetical protein
LLVEVAMAAVCSECGRELREDGICGHGAAEGGAAEATMLHAGQVFSSPMFDLSERPEGIGGWLILVALGLLVGPLFLLSAIVKDAVFLTSPRRALVGQLIPGLPALVGLEMLSSLALLAGSVVLLVLFFGKKRVFPRAYQVFLLFSVAVGLAQYTMCPRSSGASSEAVLAIVQRLHATITFAAVESVVVAVVWISYFAVSERVKATFVR